MGLPNILEIRILIGAKSKRRCLTGLAEVLP